MTYIDLQGTPYLLPEAGAAALFTQQHDIEERVTLLRREGTLTAATLRKFYGEKRFEQVAESNAIEGSTLSVGETELAVAKGVTLTGHDPKFVQDARHLDQALARLAEFARSKTPTSLNEAKAINGLVLNGDETTGEFRTYPVRISGSSHRPPATWGAIMDKMEEWSAWSLRNPALSSMIRSAVLHAWLAHIHPFGDGNGRTARAISNLEAIRAGLPPIIIKKTRDRDRYLDALRASDDGDLGPFLALIIDRTEDGLRGLELAAAAQAYSPAVAKIRRRQEGALHVWTAGVDLLFAAVAADLEELADQVGGKVAVRRYRDALSVEDFIALSQSRTIAHGWALRVELQFPALPPLIRLAWFGFRSTEMRSATSSDGGPSIYWSEPNPARYPPWRRLDVGGPGGDELTLIGDTWHVLRDRRHVALTTTELARQIAHGLALG